MNFLEIDKCNNYTILRIMSLIGYILSFVQIIVPIILIVLGTVDLIKALTAGNQDKISDAYKSIVKRFIYGILIFFIPLIVKSLMVLVSQDGEFSTCFRAISNPKEAREQADIVRGSYANSSDFKTEEECVRAGRKWIFTHSKVIGCQDNGCYICVEDSK